MDKIIIQKIVPKGSSHRYYGYDNKGKAYDMKLTSLTMENMQNPLNVIYEKLDNPLTDKKDPYKYLCNDIAILKRHSWGIQWTNAGREYKPIE